LNQLELIQINVCFQATHSLNITTEPRVSTAASHQAREEASHPSMQPTRLRYSR
jgi:hypothetical protein